MKRLILLSLAVISFSLVNAQNKPDTVAVPVFIEKRTDTLKVDVLYYLGEGGVVRWCSPGWQIREYRVASTDGKKFERLNEQPILLFALDDKKRLVKPLK